MKYTYDEIETIDKVFAIAHAFTECRHWIEMEETDNYLTEYNVKKGLLGFLPIHVDYIGDLIEEMLRWSLDYDKYTGDIGDIVAKDFYGELTPSKIRDMSHNDPIKSVSEPRYTGRHFGSAYTFDEGQFLDPDGLLSYLWATNDHDLDLDEVQRLFKIGTQIDLRDDDESYDSGEDPVALAGSDPC